MYELEEKGFGGEQLSAIRGIVDADKSDLFDVLAYIAYARPPISREERVATRRGKILAPYDAKLQTFLDFVLAQYIDEGDGQLDTAKLGYLLELKYYTVTDAAAELGSVGAIRDAFSGFQPTLYDA